MSKYYKMIPGVYPPKRIDPNEIMKHGWSVREEDGKYILRYLLAKQGGGTNEVEITKDDFEAVKNDAIDLDGLSAKYGFS